MKGPRSPGDCESLAAETQREEDEGIPGCRDTQRGRGRDSWLQRQREEGSRILAVENARGRLKRQSEMKDQGFLAAETERGTVR